MFELPLPAGPVESREVRQIMENGGHEDEQIHGKNHRFPQAGRTGDADQGAMTQGGRLGRHIL